MNFPLQNYFRENISKIVVKFIPLNGWWTMSYDSKDFLYLFGISAIGVVSIAYVLFGFSTSSSEKKIHIRGLKNVKNNCFINSILQSLASSKSMATWLSNHKAETDLIFKLSNIVERINNRTKCNANEILGPEEIINSLRKHRWVFSNDEQDAFELFSVLISTLIQESSQISFVLSVRDSLSNQGNDSSFSSPSSVECPITNRIKFASRINGSVGDNLSSLKTSLPTRGILANHLKCHNCHRNYPIYLEIFDSLSLSLPHYSNTIANDFSTTLESCLQKFFDDEVIEDFLCEYCNKKCKFTKRIQLIKLPQLLCLHLQRLVWSDQPLKRADHVKFPQILNMNSFRRLNTKITRKTQQIRNALKSIVQNGSNDGGDERNLNNNINYNNNNNNIKQSSDKLNPVPEKIRDMYLLNAVIVHLGNYNSGHFICYRRKFDSRSNINPRWYYTSDLLVKEVTETEVFSTHAYMLFYERQV